MKATGMNGSGNRFLFCMLFRAGKGKTETDRRLYFITQERDRDRDRQRQRLRQREEAVPLVELCVLYLHACLVRVTIGDSDLCCCTCVMYFKH